MLSATAGGAAGSTGVFGWRQTTASHGGAIRNPPTSWSGIGNNDGFRGQGGGGGGGGAGGNQQATSGQQNSGGGGARGGRSQGVVVLIY